MFQIFLFTFNMYIFDLQK